MHILHWNQLAVYLKLYLLLGISFTTNSHSAEVWQFFVMKFYIQSLVVMKLNMLLWRGCHVHFFIVYHLSCVWWLPLKLFGYLSDLGCSPVNWNTAHTLHKNLMVLHTKHKYGSHKNICVSFCLLLLHSSALGFACEKAFNKSCLAWSL